MVSALVVLMSTVVLEKALGHRGITITYSGKVWAEEFGTFISCADAYLCGLGKTRLSKSEQQYYICLLNELGTKAQRKAKKLGAKADVDYERMLNVLINIKERMAKGMRIIKAIEKATGLDKIKARKDEQWADDSTPEWKVKKYNMNRYAGYVYKAWNTKPSERSYSQQNALKRKENKELVSLLEQEAAIYQAHPELKKYSRIWKQLRAESNKLAEQYNLWPAYFQLERLSFSNHGFDTRPEVRDAGLEYNEKPSGLTGEWEYDTISDMADNHVAENAKLNAALKAAEYGKKWKALKGDTRPAYTKKQINGKWVLAYRHTKATDQLLDQAKANRLERQRDAWRQAAKMDERVEKTAAEKAAREAHKAKRAAKKMAAVTTFVEENYSFKSEAQELHYMELLVTSD